MNQPAKAHEPSMEEILASIRRIIADDETTKAPAQPAAPTIFAPAPPPPAPPRPAAMPLDAAEPAPVAPPSPPITQNQVDDMLAKLDDAQSRAPAEPEPSDILDLTEQMAAPAAELETSHFQTIDGEPDVIFTDPAPPSEPPRMVEEPRRAEPLRPEPPPAQIDPSLLSSSTSAAVDSAFNTLAQTVLVQNARTLEDLVREMLRPMLKSWLDDNLPGLVERIVKAEIERVSRGRG
jgi:cell pole-organizing protein PopZ